MLNLRARYIPMVTIHNPDATSGIEYWWEDGGVKEVTILDIIKGDNGQEPDFLAVADDDCFFRAPISRFRYIGKGELL